MAQNANVRGYEVHIACLEISEMADITFEPVKTGQEKESKCPRCNVPLDQVPDP